MEGLCAPRGSLESPVTLALEGHVLLEAFVSGWDPGESTPEGSPCIVTSLDYGDPGDAFDDYNGNDFDDDGCG
jgi:hypothetical protein